MEAIIKTNKKKVFNSLIKLLKSIKFDVEITNKNFELSKEQKAELDRRVIAHKNVTSKSYSDIKIV